MSAVIVVTIRDWMESFSSNKRGFWSVDAASAYVTRHFETWLDLNWLRSAYYPRPPLSLLSPSNLANKLVCARFWNKEIGLVYFRDEVTCDPLYEITLEEIRIDP